MRAALPITKDRAVALRAQLRRLCKRHRVTIAKRQALTIARIVAIHATVIQSVRELNSRMEVWLMPRRMRAIEDAVATIACLRLAVDKNGRRITHSDAPRTNHKVLWIDLRALR